MTLVVLAGLRVQQARSDDKPSIVMLWNGAELQAARDAKLGAPMVARAYRESNNSHKPELRLHAGKSVGLEASCKVLGCSIKVLPWRHP